MTRGSLCEAFIRSLGVLLTLQASEKLGFYPGNAIG